MAVSLGTLVTVAYISMNVLLTFIVSILGVKYVRADMQHRKKKANQKSLTPETETINGNNGNNDTNSTDQPQSQQTDDVKVEMVQQEIEQKMDKVTKMGFIKLYFKLVWSLRSVYLSLVIHSFDVLTDILVIIEWWDYEQKYGEVRHVNVRQMALCAIIVLCFHQFISAVAFYLKEGKIYRALAQFFAILVFEEIYSAHKKIVSHFKNYGSVVNGVESTTSFKYIRSLEAVFESIPQSVLQMVFLIRTGGKYEGDGALLIISCLSVLQSVISMTNSIIKNDNLYMDIPKFKRYKKRLPPSWPFIKHAMCRLAEVFYRISLLSLFWTVCGGPAFAVTFGVEVFFILVLSAIELRAYGTATIDDVIIRVQALVVLPTEIVFQIPADNKDVNCGFELFDDKYNDRNLFQLEYNKERMMDPMNLFATLLVTCCCCYVPAVCISTLCCFGIKKHYIHPDLRVGVSLLEWIILIVFGLLVDDEMFLFSVSHGRYVFIIGFILYLMYCQYMYFLPHFVLPHEVSIRGKCGYSFNGELEELKRMNDSDNIIKLKTFEFKKRMYNVTCNITNEFFIKHINSLSNDINISAENIVWPKNGWVRSRMIVKLKNVTLNVTLEQIDSLQKNMQTGLNAMYNDKDEKFSYTIHNDLTVVVFVNPWDTIQGMAQGTTPAMFALCNGHYDIVEWLETNRHAKRHKEIFEKQTKFKQMDKDFGRFYVDPDNKYFGLPQK